MPFNLRPKPWLPCIALMLATATASAQRGVPPPSSPPPSSALDGLPSAFDAAMLAPRQWGWDILNGEILYGLDSRLTIGVKLPYMAALAYSLKPAIGGTLRYRAFQHGRLVGALTATGTYALLDLDKGSALKHLTLAATVEFRRTANHALALTAYAGGYRIATIGTSLAMEWGTLMATHTHFPARWFGYQLGVGYMPHLQAEFVGTTIHSPSPIAARVGLMFKSSGNLLFSLGATTSFLDDGTPLPLPFINFQRAY